MRRATAAVLLLLALTLPACSIFQPGGGDPPNPSGTVLTRADLPGGAGEVEIVFVPPTRIGTPNPSK